MKNKEIPILEMIKLLGGHRATIAKDGETSEQQINNYVSKKAVVLELASGDYIVKTSKSQIFKGSK